MRRHFALLLVITALLMLSAAPGTPAHDYDRHYDNHPLRILSYPLHAVGIAAEYTFMRPLHWLVSQEHWDVIFGHEASVDDEYWSWRVTP